MFKSLSKFNIRKWGFDTESGEKTEIYEGEAHYYKFRNDVLKQMIKNFVVNGIFQSQESKHLKIENRG